MSETAVVAKRKIVAEPSPPPPAVKPAQTLRAVQPKKFPPSAMQPLGQDYEILTVIVPADWSFDEVMKPIAWGNVARIVAKNPLNNLREKTGSLVYADGPRFAAWVRINAVTYDSMGGANGLDVVCIGPSIDITTGKACPIDVKTGLPWVDPPAKEE